MVWNAPQGQPGYRPFCARPRPPPHISQHPFRPRPSSASEPSSGSPPFSPTLALTDKHALATPSSRVGTPMESDSSIEKRSVNDDVHAKPHLNSSEVDVAAELTPGKDFVLDPAEAARVRMQFADKTTLGQSAVLGLLTGNRARLNQAQFNWLGTIFYLFFLKFEWPQSLALQYLPVGKWMSFNILVWAIALLCHAAARNFGEFFACRAFLGICEGAITPGFMIVTSMFYTRQEQTQRVGLWFLMNGAAIILLGLIAFGTLHIHSGVLEAWQWLMIITGIITFIVAILFW
ncbi:hypothetical protein NUW54_g922 [Trametes sanguinea]|uniref:Uncharacterized protein n=1 Tax=Trametes sanguinea TaxID=158606 RepID=A0ACC1QA94_9APHY|nr:hypothetical protein NUW54_g922 [Trametes sanguinea]